jgi:hypothetical protein
MQSPTHDLAKGARDAKRHTQERVLHDHIWDRNGPVHCTVPVLQYIHAIRFYFGTHISRDSITTARGGSVSQQHL